MENKYYEGMSSERKMISTKFDMNNDNHKKIVKSILIGLIIPIIGIIMCFKRIDSSKATYDKTGYIVSIIGILLLIIYAFVTYNIFFT